MECIECGNEIIGKRPNSKYCSSQCLNKAKRNREMNKYLNSLNGLNTETEFRFNNSPSMQNSSEELRTIEREHFDKILNLRSEYGDKIASLKDENLEKKFKIERLNDKIETIEKDHAKALIDANKSTTKDVVQSITQMPAIQSTLGTLANSFMSKGENGLAGVVNGFSEGEKQIIESIRRMQPDAQGYLVQMLYVLFAKSNEEQMQIFTSLQAFMANTDEKEDDI
jgi:hypothetical protein